MKTITVQCTTEIKFYYDPESEAFKNTLHDFKEVIQEDAEEEDVIKNAAHQLLLRGGIDSMFEGIGYLRRKEFYRPQTEEPFSGIFVENPDPSFYYEIL